MSFICSTEPLFFGCAPPRYAAKLPDLGVFAHDFGVFAPDLDACVLTESPGAMSIPDQEDAMEDNKKEHRLSLDWWTVIVAFTLTALVLLGLPAIPW
jgi:hypothetical protein